MSNECKRPARHLLTNGGECGTYAKIDPIHAYATNRQREMDETVEKKSPIEQAGEDLFNYAIDREEIKWLLANLPKETEAKPSTVDYELQLLKIVSVGWSISFYMGGTPNKKAHLEELFWGQIHTFSQGLSETTGLMIGHDIDYFATIKERLDTYVAAMADQEDAPDPTSVIGPSFAYQCGSKEDIFIAMAGAKMFHSAVNRVRQYLEAVKLR